MRAWSVKAKIYGASKRRKPPPLVNALYANEQCYDEPKNTTAMQTERNQE
jgi:hypothetical protein